ncbi:hypothetical protein DF3PA_260019 [Candidatus Defluviicoccus seviourii]|uniref:Uncharacterized protein n=1 Tax=Candidatus Defluviicoccus seviourii TaxID=2565273 RepID=A0A564WGG5_9PROT|nr:hypothetical protein DF3PA_260019 [Candidatus Defluviicoccus seviourii]
MKSFASHTSAWMSMLSFEPAHPDGRGDTASRRAAQGTSPLRAHDMRLSTMRNIWFEFVEISIMSQEFPEFLHPAIPEGTKAHFYEDK